LPSHGSLSKSGKVRVRSPKTFREEEIKEKGIIITKKYWHKKKHKDPMRNNRKKYKRSLLRR